MNPLLAGETALVTGAGNNIGRAIALAFAREGGRVLATDVDPARGAGLLAAAGDLPVTFVAADLSQRAAAADLADRALRDLGQVSIFVHCASPPRPETQHVMGVTEAEFDAMHEVNVRAGFTIGQRLGAQMIARKIAGRMVYVTSLHADTPRNLPHYSSAKAGMTMVMKEFARAFGPHGIRVNALAPGAILGGGSSTAADPRLTDMIALKRPGTADEIADMALVLCADRFSRYVTGTTLVVDGGISLTNWITPYTA